MNILITGGTGFIGSQLCERLLALNHQLMLLTRNPTQTSHSIQFISDLNQLNNNTEFEVVINLAGEPIANGRWSDARKNKIIESRLGITKQLITFFNNAEVKPKLFISGSAIGYYGISNSVGANDQAIIESDKGDVSFSSQLCQKWEDLAKQAEQLGIRTCLLRTGIVLGKNGGALNKMLLPFKMGLGGKIGSGNQWMSWIHIDDLIGIILHCINDQQISGPINGCAPNAVTNKEFTQTLGSVLHRPTIVPMPSIMIKILMGEMGKQLLLSGKKILPKKAQDYNYIFEYNYLKDALIQCV